MPASDLAVFTSLLAADLNSWDIEAVPAHEALEPTLPEFIARLIRFDSKPRDCQKEAEPSDDVSGEPGRAATAIHEPANDLPLDDGERRDEPDPEPQNEPDPEPVGDVETLPNARCLDQGKQTTDDKIHSLSVGGSMS